MRQPLVTQRPLSRPSLQLSLLLPVFLLLVLGRWPGPPPTDGPPVMFPRLQGAPPQLKADLALFITLQADGSVFIDHKWYPVAELLSGLQARVRQDHALPVVFRADRLAPFGAVRSVLSVLRTAGVASVFLETDSYNAFVLDVPVPASRPAT